MKPSDIKLGKFYCNGCTASLRYEVRQVIDINGCKNVMVRYAIMRSVKVGRNANQKRIDNYQTCTLKRFARWAQRESKRVVVYVDATQSQANDAGVKHMA